MSTLDSSSGDIQDQSQGSYSPHLYPCSPSPASADGLSSTMQTQLNEAPKSPRFCASSPSPASFCYDAPNSPRFCASSPPPASSHDAPKSPCSCASSPHLASSDTAAPTVPPSASPTAAPTVPPSASPTASPTPEVCSKDATGLPYPTAESYFMRPEVLRLMAGPPKEPKLQTSFVSQTTSHNLTLLYQECQMRGLTPRFEIEGNQLKGFGGNVKIGEKTATTEDRWRSKKGAKEGLAEKVLDFVKELPSQKRKRPAAEPEENWIGLLHDHYLPTVATTGGPVFLEYTRGIAFACTCQIPAHPNLFGSESNPVFPSRKAARSNAAKEALQFLIAQGLAPSDASFRKGRSKKAKMDAAAAMAAMKQDAEKTFAKKINELCPLLSLPLPEYRFSQSDSSPPNIFSGGAYFPASTPAGLLPTLGPIGLVKDVSGRKAAKDQCAKLLLEFLREWMESQDQSKIMGKEASGGDGKVGTGGENRDGGVGKKKQD